MVAMISTSIIYGDLPLSKTSTEGFTAPIGYKMGQYSGKILRPEGGSYWRHPPSNVPLYQSAPLVLQGDVPEKTTYTQDIPDVNAVSVDGSPEARKSLFMFKYNQSSPECCPATFSDSSGCVCTTKKQRQFINRRGVPGLKYREYPGI